MNIKKILLLFVPLIALVGCGEPEIPENYGVYARLTNGDLVKLDRMSNVQHTKMLFFGNNDSISTSEAYSAPRMNYILEKPTVILDMDEVEGFIIYGEKRNDKVKIKYFADAKSFNGKFFDNKGKGDVNETTFIDQGWSCAQADGMEYKKINEDMYLYNLPSKEKGDFKYCSLETFKEVGKGTRKSPYVAIDFYGWYYDGSYWAFNVEGEDSKGKENEISRKKAIEDRIAKTLAKEKAEKQAKKKRKEEEILAYETVPVVKSLKYFSEADNIFSFTAQKGDGEGYSLSKDSVCLGAFCSDLYYRDINEFALDELLEKHKSYVMEFKNRYGKKTLLDSHVKVKDLNIPAEFNKRGWLKIAHSDTVKHVEPLFGLYQIPTELGVNIASKEISSFLRYKDEKFVFGTELIAEGYNSYRDRGGMSFKLNLSEKEILTLGKATSGKATIEEITLKYLKTDDRHRGVGTRSLFYVSSFKLKSMEGRFIIADTDDNKYVPHVYVPLNVKPKGTGKS
jgi:hypothetical protein